MVAPVIIAITPQDEMNWNDRELMMIIIEVEFCFIIIRIYHIIMCIVCNYEFIDKLDGCGVLLV